MENKAFWYSAAVGPCKCYHFLKEQMLALRYFWKQKKWSCVFVFLKKKKKTPYISRISSYSDAVRDAITEKPSAGDTLSMVQAMYKETELAFFIYNGCL